MDTLIKKHTIMLAGFVIGRYSDLPIPDDMPAVRSSLQDMGIPTKEGEEYAILLQHLVNFLDEQNETFGHEITTDTDEAWERAMKTVC